MQRFLHLSLKFFKNLDPNRKESGFLHIRARIVQRQKLVIVRETARLHRIKFVQLFQILCHSLAA